MSCNWFDAVGEYIRMSLLSGLTGSRPIVEQEAGGVSTGRMKAVPMERYATAETERLFEALIRDAYNA